MPCRAQNTTAKSYGRTALQGVWRVDRHGEAPRFKAHDGLSNRKLLWHGTKWVEATQRLAGRSCDEGKTG